MSQVISTQESDSIVKVSVVIRRNYGKVEIELGAEVYANIRAEGDFTRSFNELYDAVQVEHKSLVERLARENASPQTTADFIAQNQTSQSGLTTIIDVNNISVELKGDVRYYKVRGGEFSKWGVRVWPDEHVLIGLNGLVDLRDIVDVWTPEQGVQLQAKVELKNGKPTKVLAFRVV